MQMRNLIIDIYQHTVRTSCCVSSSVPLKGHHPLALLILNKLIVGAFDSRFFNVHVLGALAALGSLDKSTVTVPIFTTLRLSCIYYNLVEKTAGISTTHAFYKAV